jgi:hypothetical protein
MFIKKKSGVFQILLNYKSYRKAARKYHHLNDFLLVHNYFKKYITLFNVEWNHFYSSIKNCGAMPPTAIICAVYKQVFCLLCYIHIGKGHTMPCLCRHRENVEVQLLPILTMLQPPYPQCRPSTQHARGLVGLGVSLEGMGNFTPPGFNPQTIHPIGSHYTALFQPLLHMHTD